MNIYQRRSIAPFVSDCFIETTIFVSRRHKRFEPDETEQSRIASCCAINANDKLFSTWEHLVSK